MGSQEQLQAMEGNPKFIFFTDFDGTITLQDSNDFMTDNLGFGAALRKQGNKDVLDGVKTFRECFKEMMDSVKTPYSQCIQFLVDNIQLDPHFPDFLKFAAANNIPVVVLSGGMHPIIEALLKHMVGNDADKLRIVSNRVKLRQGFKSMDDEGGWELVFHDDTGFGHDKSLSIRPYAKLPKDQRPTLFYAGDGVSDLSAARETDLLFAKRGRDLVSYCVREDVPFTVFDDWSDILAQVKEIVEGRATVEDAAAEGYKAYKASVPASRIGDRLAAVDGKKSGHTTPYVLEAGGGSRPLKSVER